MFILSTLTDLIEITPEDFKKPSEHALEDNINAKYADKVRSPFAGYPRMPPLTTAQVIQKVGLCICLYDIIKYSEGLIGHGTGIVNVNGTKKTFFSSNIRCFKRAIRWV